MSLAADTREAVRDRPFLLDALRAGVLNHSAAAAWLLESADLDGDPDAVATALRRFREELPAYATADRTASVTIRSGVGIAGDGESGGAGDSGSGDPLLRVGGAAVVPEGSHTALLATGEVDAAALAAALARLDAAGVAVAAAGVAAAGDAVSGVGVSGDDDGSLVVVVGRRDGASALRVVEDALAAVPAVEDE
ncbi:DUF7523 family protein [Halorubrum halodurans]|uniref:Uncharacterized protein n=1 Tax=Halorubrum halodurans TaxID=1383851 RepID=A0A256IE63_9EURY|nr:hypothetical protein [Halorubrum halodurans]OYR54841.1 hypothetical protein DJ70_13015 [Halorubrum halodurans]